MRVAISLCIGLVVTCAAGTLPLASSDNTESVAGSRSSPATKCGSRANVACERGRPDRAVSCAFSGPIAVTPASSACNEASLLLGAAMRHIIATDITCGAEAAPVCRRRTARHTATDGNFFISAWFGAVAGNP